MRIAVDARVLCLREIRGIGNYLANVLRRWPDSDDEFLLLIEDGDIHKDIISPALLTTHRITAPPGNRFHVWEWWSLPRFVSGKDIDLLWSPANVTFPVAALPQIVTIHDTLLQEKVRFSRWSEGLYFTKLQPWMAQRYAMLVITVSNFSRQRINDVFSYDSSRIRVIYNGTNFSRSTFPSKAEATSFLHAHSIVDRPYIYILGAESDWKNTDAAVRAFKGVLASVPDITCVISGIQERVRPRFTDLCRSLDLENHVQLLGFLDPTTRDALYQGAELFVYPSLFEGFGLPPLEAMALGTPVVASNAASIPEVVGGACWLVDAQNENEMAMAITCLLKNPGLRESLRQRGYDNCQHFDWGLSAMQHKRFFAETSINRE